jgi:hypothetical protein
MLDMYPKVSNLIEYISLEGRVIFKTIVERRKPIPKLLYSWRVKSTQGLVDGNYRVEIYIHLLDLTRNRSEKCNYKSLT